MLRINVIIIPILLAVLALAALVLSLGREQDPATPDARVVHNQNGNPGFYRPYRGWGRAPEREPWTQG